MESNLMKKQLFQIPKTAAILSLVLVFALSTVWGTTNRYSDSVVMKQGRKSKNATLKLVRNEVEAKIRKWSVDSYLNEKGINEVEITCKMTEKLVDHGDGTYYQLKFNFGPNDVYFDTPLELTIQGKYIETSHDLVLLDPDGNPLEVNKITGNGEVTYEIDHFSTYQYVSSGDEDVVDESGDEVVVDESSDEVVVDEGATVVADEEVIDNYNHEWASTHFASAEIGVDGGNIHVNSEASIKIKRKALAEYLDEQGVDSVVITVKLYYGWDGTLLFVFGPSGAHFEPDLELTIEGGYIEDQMLFIGEDGEMLEYVVKKKGTKLIFKLNHFSRYSYDHYDY